MHICLQPQPLEGPVSISTTSTMSLDNHMLTMVILVVGLACSPVHYLLVQQVAMGNSVKEWKSSYGKRADSIGIHAQHAEDSLAEWRHGLIAERSKRQKRARDQARAPYSTDGQDDGDIKINLKDEGVLDLNFFLNNICQIQSNISLSPSARKRSN